MQGRAGGRVGRAGGRVGEGSGRRLGGRGGRGREEGVGRWRPGWLPEWAVPTRLVLETVLPALSRTGPDRSRCSAVGRWQANTSTPPPSSCKWPPGSGLIGLGTTVTLLHPTGTGARVVVGG